MKPKTVKAWAWSIDDKDGSHWIQTVNAKCKKSDAVLVRSQYVDGRYQCGPIVRIEVPAPKEKSK